MKKILIVLIMLMTVYSIPKITMASHYKNFEDFDLKSGKLIENYTSSELKPYYKKVDKKKFLGWQTAIVNNRAKATFIRETLFTYYNDGYTPIDYSYKSEQSETTKLSVSTTGSIGVNVSGSKDKFKGGLDGSLKIVTVDDQQNVKKEVYEVKMKVDPGTQITLYNYGEGYLTNGVAAKYVIWIKANRGTFEYFEITTLYYRLEKVKI